MKEKTEKKIRFWCRIFLGVYLVLLVYFLIFSEEWGRTFLEGEYRYNLVPFQEISRYLRYREQIGIGYVFLNLGGNVIGFIPFGALLPSIGRKPSGFLRTTFIGFELSLMVELSQLVLKVGSCDVDDVLLNTWGCCLGWIVPPDKMASEERKTCGIRKKSGSRIKSIPVRESYPVDLVELRCCFLRHLLRQLIYEAVRQEESLQ